MARVEDRASPDARVKESLPGSGSKGEAGCVALAVL